MRIRNAIVGRTLLRKCFSLPIFRKKCCHITRWIKASVRARMDCTAAAQNANWWLPWTHFNGPSTLATLFSHSWLRFCGGPEHTRATCGGDSKVSYPPAKFPYSAKFPTLLSGCHMPHEQSLVCSERRTQPQKRSVCGGDEPQPVAHLSHKLECVRQSLKIMVSYGNKYPLHKNAATCG